MSQGKPIEVLHGQHGDENSDHDEQGSARLDQISEIVAGLRVGAESLPQNRSAGSARPRNQGLARFRASAEDFVRQTRKTEIRADWADSTRESISNMMDDMFINAQRDDLPEFLSAQDNGFQKRQNRILNFVAVFAGILVFGATGYGFYHLGLNDATVSRSQDTADLTAASGQAAPDGAASRQNHLKDQSRLTKEDLAQPLAAAPASKSVAVASGAQKPPQGRGEGLPDNIPAGAADRTPDATPETKSDTAPVRLVEPVEIETEVVMPGVKSADSSANPLPADGAVKAEAKAPAPAAPKADEAPAAKPEVRLAAKAPTPAAGDADAAEPETASEQPLKAGAGATETGEGATLEGLLNSVVESIRELGKPPGETAVGQDPVKELRTRMTKLAAKATMQGKTSSDVKQMLEARLASLAPEAIPDVLKNAGGKVDVSPLVSAVTRPEANLP